VLVSQRIGFSISREKSALTLVDESGEGAVIRGIRNLQLGEGEGAPLIVVDGVIIGGDTKQALAEINPDDIETIEVIKGAAAVELYGERGANGVIQIFTKNAINITGLKSVPERN
jgi:TonB-dependent SusC/RagA subfamily outer membrane receptor